MYVEGEENCELGTKLIEKGKGVTWRAIKNSYQDFGWVVKMNMNLQGGEATELMEAGREHGSGNGGAQSIPTLPPHPKS